MPAKVLLRRVSLTVAEEITQAATAANSDTDRPLPLLALWDPGGTDLFNLSAPVAAGPSWQLDQIDAGRHLFPCFQQPDYTMLDSTQAWINRGSLLWPDYYNDAIDRCKAANLPICFVGTQWETVLSQDTRWSAAAYADNPNVWIAGAAVNAVAAFGPTTPWSEVGDKWTNALNQNGEASMLSSIQSRYPNPPKVLWVSNNEANKEQWYAPFGNDVDSDQHYLDLYSAGASDEVKKERLTAGWIVRYPLMIAAMRANLPSAWQDRSQFIGYNAFGPMFLGRFAGWVTGGLDTTSPLRIDPNPLMWEGGSPNLYNNLEGFDDQVHSPQVEGCNLVFMRAEALALNPTFWVEISTWNSNDYDPPSDAPGADAEAQALLTHSPSYTPARYAGMSQFTMWLLRPRAQRMFAHSGTLLSEWETHFNAVADTVDRVYTNSTLRAFWRFGTLVANPDRAHPYQSAIPAGYASAERSYLLTTDQDPHGGDTSLWATTDSLPLSCLALVRGTTPSRTWLVYGFAPGGSTSATVTVPDYGDITKSFAVAGTFYLCTEGGGVTEVS